jgi:uncharacterized repeat protein (TIGR03803 family)
MRRSLAVLTANRDPLSWEDAMKLRISAALAIVGFAFAGVIGSAQSLAQTPTTLYSFCSQPNCTDGIGSAAPLVQAVDGDFYGTTGGGGADGYGTVFKITAGGNLTTLYSFCSQPNCTDGAASVGGSPGTPPLVQATNGDFYGTTGGGSACASAGDAKDCGTIFKISTGGNLTTLYTFCSQPNCADGVAPNGLVQAANGDFYGTTSQGGDALPPYGTGTIFKITSAGTLTTLYTFCSQPNCADGGSPYGTLVQATDGNFYGTTWTSGLSGTGPGAFFKITPGGTLTTLGYIAGYPSGTLVQAKDGNFYGTTSHAGTIFKITPAGALTTLASACCYPYAGLVQATDGNFYGTTYVGGNYGYGSVFEVTPAGTLTTLYSFCSQPNCPDGAEPIAGLIQATNGKLYGTTLTGGPNFVSPYGFAGIVFSLDVGLAPLPSSEVATTASGLAYSRVSRTFNGTVTITNISSGTISGPFQVLFTVLTAGVTMVNATGNFSGAPYLTTTVASLAAGQSATVNVQFDNPSFATINFTPVIYSGSI